MKSFHRILCIGLTALALSRTLRAEDACGGDGLIWTVMDSGGAVGLSAGDMTLNASLGQPFMPASAPESAIQGGDSELKHGFYYRALFSGAAQNIVLFPTASQVTLPAGAISVDYELLFNFTPRKYTLMAAPQDIADADRKMGPVFEAVSRTMAQGTLEIAAKDECGRFLKNALSPAGELALGYADADNNGIVDGTHPGISANSLRIYYLDAEQKAWIPLPNSRVDTAARRVTGHFSRFGVFALVGTALQNDGQVYAYPAPWDPHSGDPSRGSEACGITFSNIWLEGTIKIYTVSGQIVRTMNYANLPQGACAVGNQLSWDVTTDDGSKAASGVYVWRVESGSQSKTGKLMVIR